jgi:23S rRNA (adenine2503-C2)-methyltransferase
MPEGDGGEAGDGSLSGDEELEGSKGWQRATICISSQVGCAVDCKFLHDCPARAKTQSDRRRNCGPGPAVLGDCRAEPERDRLNLVFMGQGEPFLNYDNFHAGGAPAGGRSWHSRVAHDGVDLGNCAAHCRLRRRSHSPKLAVSLNAPNEELRTRIMPITKKWTIEKLMAALRDFPLRNRERLTFEYVLLGGVNDDCNMRARWLT